MCNTMNEREYQTADELKNTGGVHEKIDEAKKYFKDVQKTGRNNYQKYNYLELHDIRPVVMKVCDELKLRTRFTWNTDNLTLCITDKEDGSSEYYQIPVPPQQNHVVIDDYDKYMKAVGKVQTYSMRYLYIQAFEISVPDKIDQGKPVPKKYHNGPKMQSTPGNAKPVDQTTLNTEKNKDRLHDLTRRISEEMAEKGIENTTSNIRDYTTDLFKKGKLSNVELRFIREKLQTGEVLS